MSKRTTTIADAIDEHLAERAAQVTPVTVERERVQLRSFLISMGTNKGLANKDSMGMIEELARRTQRWVDSIESGAWWKSANLATAKRFFSFCVRRGYLRYNPGQFVKGPVLRKRTLPIFTHLEYLRIKEYTKGTHNYWLTVCACKTGLSRVDICNLKWASVDMERMVIALRRQKVRHTGAGEVIIPILPGSDLYECLTLFRELPDTDDWPGPGYVCHDLARRYHVDSSSLVQSYTRMLRELGITDKTFKNWRNTFISAVANSGVPTSIACKMSGHSNPAMLARYIKPDIAALRDCLIKANEFMENKNENKIQLKR